MVRPVCSKSPSERYGAKMSNQEVEDTATLGNSFPLDTKMRYSLIPNKIKTGILALQCKMRKM